jgi:hypothetical protein
MNMPIKILYIMHKKCFKCMFLFKFNIIIGALFLNVFNLFLVLIYLYMYEQI